MAFAVEVKPARAEEDAAKRVEPFMAALQGAPMPPVALEEPAAEAEDDLAAVQLETGSPTVHPPPALVVVQEPLAAPRTEPEATAQLARQQATTPPPAAATLGSAIRDGDLALVLELLEAKADPNELDELGETPLFEAADRSNPDVVAALLIKSADPNIESLNSMVAREFARDDASKTLLDLFGRREVSLATVTGPTPWSLSRRTLSLVALMFEPCRVSSCHPPSE